MSYTVDDFIESVSCMRRKVGIVAPEITDIACVLAAWGKGEGMGGPDVGYGFSSTSATEWSRWLRMRTKRRQERLYQVQWFQERPDLAKLAEPPVEWDIEPVESESCTASGVQMIPSRPTLEQAMHAAAPKGLKCADCSIDGEPCPTCYAAAWKRRHPNHVSVSMASAEPEPQKVYLVSNRSGEYDDYRSYPVRAFVRMADAKAFAEQCRAYVAKIPPYWDGDYADVGWDKKYDRAARKRKRYVSANPYDQTKPESEDTEYHVDKLPFGTLSMGTIYLTPL